MAVTLARLRIRLGDISAGFTDPVLQEFVDTAVNDYGQNLAAKAAANYMYSQDAETVDKRNEPGAWRALFEQTWSSLPESVRTRGGAAPDSFELRKDEVEESTASE
jgi:hypothetical protein